ncbi:MAG: acyltransferase family protein [Agriterribacter sp.]
MIEDGKRIHGLDALRAVAMLLGVVLHSAIAYKFKPHRNWAHDDQFNSWVFDYLYFMIHSFRMALFFLVAGFFARLLYYKIGEKQFIIHRWKRVGIPFILAMIFILPFSIIPHNFYLFYYRDGMPFMEALKRSVFKIFGYNGLAHLWFLYDLIIFYVIMIITLRLKKIAFIGSVYKRISGLCSNMDFRRWYWVLIAIIPVWVCLLPEKGLLVITDTSLIPKRINNLFFYGYMFLLGWLFNMRSDIFPRLINNYRLLLISGFILGCISFYFEWTLEETSAIFLKLLAKIGTSLQIICFVLGFLGFFLSFFKFKSDKWSYISDASYWVYLIHLGIVTTLQICFLNSNVPGMLRFPLVLSISLIVSFVTYQLFVRYTFIGNLLHGRRNKV